MVNRRPARIIALGVLMVAAGVGGYFLLRSGPAPSVVGVVRATQIRIAPEVGGQLAAIQVPNGGSVRAGDVVAQLSALELSAAVALAVLERRLDKSILRAPADGVVSVIVAEVGENIVAGQPVLAIEETGKQWLSFNVREDFLHGIRVGMTVDVGRMGTSETTPALVTELLRLGPFAT